jgi:hypothetical protein
MYHGAHGNVFQGGRALVGQSQLEGNHTIWVERCPPAEERDR